ncbi:hypothetical protein G6F57_019102 [Rhizopus arrhizus]|nr:hypothetical protein G6F57_019102 [Rhizopus arrhizus]
MPSRRRRPSGRLSSWPAAAIHKGYIQERERLYQRTQRRQWADWLKQQATEGNSEALAALRAREAAQGLKGNTIAAHGKTKAGHAPVVDNITKKGTIIFRAGKSAVRDDGDKLQVSTGADRAGVQEALRLAAERYGDCITVNGTTEFKAQAIRAAAASGAVARQFQRDQKAGDTSWREGAAAGGQGGPLACSISS